MCRLRERAWLADKARFKHDHTGKSAYGLPLKQSKQLCSGKHRLRVMHTRLQPDLLRWAQTPNHNFCAGLAASMASFGYD